MSKYGLTIGGFKIPTFDIIKGEIESNIVSKLGAIDFEVPSVYGVLTSITAERERVLWEKAQEAYNSFFVDTATGVSLDYVVAGNLIVRQKATATKVTCQLTGTNYTTIPAGSEVLLKNTKTIFKLSEQIVLSNDACFSIDITVNDIEQDRYTVKINNQAVAYEKLENDTKDSILQGLSDLINEGSYNVVTDIVGSSLKITTVDLLKSFSCYIDEGLNIERVTNNGIFICTELGNIAAPSHSIVDIQTPIAGWRDIDNISSGTTGRNLETDVELRQRHQDSLSIGGSSTEPAIQARLAQVPGVTSVRVISDRENHTINALVLGGEDIEVANMLQLVRPAGIRLIGNKEITITSNDNTQYTIKFTRPQNVYIYIEINITKSDVFVESAITTIENKIINYVNSLGVSSIVAYQALYAAIYSVTGVINATVAIGGTLDENIEPMLKSENIIISGEQMPITNASKITINVN